MESGFSEEKYNEMIEKLFTRFPSFQKAGASAYKPGIANMEFVDSLMGHPHKNYKIIHVAGTNGKGSVSNMLASALAASGYKVGLYTSPHIIDFRERMRIIVQMEENIAKALHIDVDQINVKATTEEGLGFTGTEEGISSQAICCLTTIYESSVRVADSENPCAGCHNKI
jgi:folylpolyglutamate synthase/dihydropteroate synthase